MQPSNLPRNLLVFGRLLRSVGIDVHVGRLLDVTNALQYVDLASRAEVFHTCRALLVYRPDQLATFERAFDAFWLGRLRVAPTAKRDAGTPGPDRPEGPMSDEGPTRPLGEGELPVEDSAVDGATVRTWSDAAVLADKDVSEFTADELAVARTALTRLVWNPGERRTRRWIRGRGSRIDLRRALARSLRTGGDILTLPRQMRRTRPRSLVLLCDVSGSMERYSRMLLHFVHALSRRHRRVEVFLFSTQLTRVTMQLRARGVTEAVVAASGVVPDWSGGTRIGAAIGEFHRAWARRVLRGGPVVLLISDGWDRGDPHDLRKQVARLQRSCHRLIWLNPLIGTVDYAPLTRGLQAALPHVDDFLPVRTLSNLVDLAVHLNALVAPTRPTRALKERTHTTRSWTLPAPTPSPPRPNGSGIS